MESVTEIKLPRSERERYSELLTKVEATNFIKEMSVRLHVPNKCACTAVMYMQRFYRYHSFTEWHSNSASVAALLLAAKMEDQLINLEYIIKVCLVCLHEDALSLDVRSKVYCDKESEVVAYENILLQTLGFKLDVTHSHPSTCLAFILSMCQHAGKNPADIKAHSSGHTEKKKEIESKVQSSVHIQVKQKLSLEEYHNKRREKFLEKENIIVKNASNQSQRKRKLSLQEYQEKRKKLYSEKENLPLKNVSG